MAKKLTRAERQRRFRRLSSDANRGKFTTTQRKKGGGFHGDRDDLDQRGKQISRFKTSKANVTKDGTIQLNKKSEARKKEEKEVAKRQLRFRSSSRKSNTSPKRRPNTRRKR